MKDSWMLTSVLRQNLQRDTFNEFTLQVANNSHASSFASFSDASNTMAQVAITMVIIPMGSPRRLISGRDVSY